MKFILPLFLAAAYLGSVSQATAQLTELWLIGEDNDSQDEFEHEADGDDFFYLEDGDYTDLEPAGDVWEDGPEEWNDGEAGNEIGFERALTQGDSIINIYFQLTADQGQAGTTFQFDVDFSAAEGGSSHDIELSMNGTPFHVAEEVMADVNNVLVSDTFFGFEVGAQEGPNVLSLERTSGTGSWVQLDYLTLQADTSTAGCEDPICQFNGSTETVAPGGMVTLSWIADPTATLSIEPGVGSVDAQTTSGIGSIDVSPTANTTYTLTSTRGADVDTSTFAVSVGNIVSFTATPNQVLPNAITTLSWDVDPSASVSIEGIGSVDAQTTDGVGSIEVTPAETTTYTLTSTRGADVETAMTTVTVNNFTTLWLIGDDDGDQDEFEHEADADDFFYLDNGDYSDLEPAGEVWTDGPETWNDDMAGNEIGFERALTEGDSDINIYFQLNPGQANSGTTFLLNTEFADAEADSSHDVEFSLNGDVFHLEEEIIADLENEALVSTSFTGEEGGAVAGSNVLTISRVGGSGAWIQLDYVELKADLSTANCAEPICSYAATSTVVAPGGSVELNWAVDPTAVVTIDQGIGNVDDKTTSGIGTVKVSPTANTTYTLTSTVGGEVATEEVTIEVQNITSFSGDSAIARPGSPVTLSWQVDPAASVSIDQGVGAVASVDGAGSVEVSPTATTTYTLTSTRGADVETTTFTVVFVDLALIWAIGEDNNSQAEFEHEADGDDFFYVEDGDYSDTSPDDGDTFGDIWEDGPEPWSDGLAGNEIGFERALTIGDPTINVFFQLEPQEASEASVFTFNVEFRAPEEGSTHTIDLLMNGNVFQTLEEVDAAADMLFTETFTGSDVEAQPGPNVLTIARTEGSGAWIQLDYLTLEVQSIGETAFEISEIAQADGDVTLTWNSSPGATYTVESSPELETWSEVADGIPSGGTSTSFTDTSIPAGTLFHYFRIIEE